MIAFFAVKYFLIKVCTLFFRHNDFAYLIDHSLVKTQLFYALGNQNICDSLYYDIHFIAVVWNWTLCLQGMPICDLTHWYHFKKYLVVLFSSVRTIENYFGNKFDISKLLRIGFAGFIEVILSTAFLSYLFLTTIICYLQDSHCYCGGGEAVLYQYTTDTLFIWPPRNCSLLLRGKNGWKNV